MADENFKYIINATLKLNTGSLTSLVKKIKDMDKDIKAEFDKQGSSVKVPLTADPNIEQLRKGVNRIIESYNKGQAPAIRLRVEPDESSIKELQNRISELKRQMNSLSDDKEPIRLSTSLVVDKNAGESVQKQAEDVVKPVIEVQFVPNEDSLKKLKEQVESIKAEVQATVHAVQNNPQNLRTFTRVDRNSPAPASVGSMTRTFRVANRPNTDSQARTQANRVYQQESKAIQSDINTMQGNMKLLQEELKLQLSAEEIEKRIEGIENARSKPYYHAKDSKGKFIKGGRVNASDYDETLKSLRAELENLKKVEDLEKQIAERQKALGNAPTTAPKSKKKIVQWTDNSLPSPRTVQDQNRKAEKRKHDQMEQMKRWIQNPDDAWGPAWEQYNNVGRVQDVYKAWTQADRVNSSINRRNVDPMQQEIDRAHRQAERMDRVITARRLASQPSIWGTYTQPQMDNFHQRALNEERKRQNAIYQANKNRIQSPDDAWDIAQDMNLNYGRVYDPNRAQIQANRINRQMSNKSDFDNHRRRWGGNKEYSATDLEAMLADPNVSLADSMSIIRDRLHPINQAQAVASKSNFQKAYAVNYTDADGNVRTIRTLTTQYTKLGEVIERGDKGFGEMMSHITSKVGIYSTLEMALVGVSTAFVEGVKDMADFDAQMAEVIATTQKLTGTGTQLSDFYSSVGGTSSMQSQVQNNTFQNAETYGVSALDTVMPIEEQVLARRQLVTGANGKYDSSMKDQIVKNIMQFSAISTNGKADPQETSDLTKDALSLYQAYYNPNVTNPNDPKYYMNQMSGVFDNLTALKMRGVNTTAVSDALAELAPDTIASGVDSTQVMGMLGGYNLADASATGDDIQTIGRTFFSSLRHASTNDKLKSALRNYMGIDLDSQNMSTPELLKAMLGKYGGLNDATKEAFAGAFAGTSGKGTAMTPKMIKFLDATQSQDYKQFMQDAGDGTNVGAMDKNWGPFSAKLKTQFDGLVEKLQEFTQLIGKLGAMDSLGLIVKGFSGLLSVVNAVLRSVQSLSDVFGNHNIFNVAGFVTQVTTAIMALKGLQAIMNKKAFGSGIADWLAGRQLTGGRTFGIKTTSQRIEAELVRSGATPEMIADIMPQVNASRNTRLASQLSRAGVGEEVVASTMNTLGSNVVANTTANTVEKSTEKVIVQDAVNAVEKGKGAKALSSVGSFMSDALFLSFFKGKSGTGVAEAGAEAVAKASPWTKFSEWIISVLPALRSFGLLLTRLSLIGGAIALGMAGYNYIKNDEAKQTALDVGNADKNFQKLAKGSKKDRNNTVSQIQDWVKQNSATKGMDAQSFHMTQTARTTNNAKQRNNWNMQYHGFGDNAYITYQDKQKQMHTAHVNNTKEMNGMYDTFKNSGLTDVEQLADAWKVNTDSLTSYTNELTMVNVLSKSLSANMREISTSQKEIDARYGGVSSVGSLQEKINVTQQGLDKSKTQGQALQSNVSDITSEYNKTQNSYDYQVQKALKTGLVSKSDIQDAITQFEVAKAGGQPYTTVLDTYKSLDPTNADDEAKIKKQKMSKKDIEQYNTKNDAITSVLQLYQSMSSAKDLYTSGTDNLSQYLDQQYQYQESIKQMTAQLTVAKLGLDAMNASLQTLGAIASASKALVDINTNTLQTGDNSGQISALSTSMGISSAQMGNMVSQNSIMQKQMADIAKANPTQDFSLNALYNPTGDVTAQQMAYKTLYEQSQQMTQNISNQSSAMYQQLTQLKDLVLNSNEYADSWQRIQQTVQDVKDSIKSANDFQYQMASLNDNATMTAGLTGQKIGDVKAQLLSSLRDNSLQLTTKLNTDGTSLGHDTSMLNQAWQDIINEEGKSFQDNMINPLKNIVSSATNSNTAFGNSVSSFNNAVNNFSGAVNTASKNAEIAQAAQQAGAPAPSSSNYSAPASTAKTGSIGGVSNTGQTFKLGFSEENYATSLSAISAGKYKGNENDFVVAGAKYNVDPNLLMAIAMQENSGNSSLLNNAYNVGSIKATGSSPEWNGSSYGGYRKYTSLQQGIDDLAHLISSKIANGYNTIPLINSNYAQSPSWMDGVAYFMAKATNTTTQTWLGNASDSNGYHLAGNDGGDPSYKGGGSSSSSGSSGATTTANLHLRSTPSTNGKIVETLPAGTTYKSYGEQNGWVNLGNGWASAQYLTGNFNSAGGSSTSTGGNGGVNGMFNWLNSVKGNTNAMTYQWGGAHQTESWAQFLSKAVADCSGLVEQVYKQFAGVNLGTTTAQGIYSDNNGGTRVSSKSQLQPGDIVFFGSDASHITHTGIYAGNGQDYAIDNTGKPVSLDNMAGQNYVGGKHFNIQSGTMSQNPADSTPTALQVLTGTTSKYHDSVTAELGIVGNSMSQITQQINDSIGQAIANGNIADVMGSSGVTGKFDAIAQARQNIATQMINNHDQINANLQTRSTLISGMASASKSGDTASYNLYKQMLNDTDSLIKSLQANTTSLQSLDASYKAQQQSDPRLALNPAHDMIVGGLNQLKTYDANGSGMGVDFMRVVNEVNNMKSQYLDHTKETQSLSTLFGNYGAEAQWYSNSKATSDQDAINLVQTQITNINNLFKNLAQGTEQWYSTLDIAVQAEQQLHDLEQKRLQDAQTMFQLTGQGIQGYVEQKAYVQSKDYSQNNQDLQTALQQYKSGTLNKGSFLSSGEYLGSAGANKTADYLRHTYGISANVQDMGVQYQQVGNVGKGVKVYSNPNGTGKVTESLASGNYKVYSSQNGYYGVGNAGWVKASDMTGVTDTYRVTTSADLTSGSVNSINKDLQSKGLSHLTYSSNAGSSTEDFNQQLANLQAIADAHNNMIQQMNDYKQAVTDSFKAGAMSVDEYISKLNQLRDKETEAKDNATNMISTIQGGFQSSLSDAISNGLQGSLNSPLDFMNSIKSTIAGGLAGQLSQTLLQNTGLQDVMNKITSSLTNASTSGNASDIVNMFNNNDFGKQMQDALAPFLPMIQQIVGSAQGIFTILKDQTFNAPSGFKVDNYMNEVANSIGYQGIKTMNPNTNSVGSQINTFPDTPPITTTAPSETPTGVPTTTSGSGATSTGAPENTTGSSTGAPTTSQTSAPSIPSTPIPSAPKAPTTSTGSASSYHSGQVVHAHGNVWLHKTPDTNTSSRLRLLPNGSAWKSYGFKNGMIDLGSGYASGKYVYHTGGIAGMMNFASGQGLKPNELSAILQKSETVFQPRQVDDLVNGAMKAGANANNSGSGVNINVTVNFSGDTSSKSSIEETVQTAVQKALDQFKRTTKMNNLTWKGTSY